MTPKRGMLPGERVWFRAASRTIPNQPETLATDAQGSPYLRKALHQAAFVGIAERKYQPVNPVIRRFYDLKKSQGKPGKVALCAAASKLLCMVFGIMKSGKPFEVR